MTNRKKFSELNKEIQVLRLTSPAYVVSVLDPDLETKEQINHRLEKLFSLPHNIQFKLSSHETIAKVQLIGRKYSLKLSSLAHISRLIREYYFGEVKLEDFPKEIEKRMKVNPVTAREIARYIQTEIIDWDPYAEYIASLPQMTIREALKKYPKVADQQISSGYLELKGQEDVFDGTIRNWIQDYVLHLGQEKHDSMDRMNYLFNTENTKKLSSLEREKLGIILKSADENALLPVDIENNELILDHLIGKKSTESVRPKEISPKIVPPAGEKLRESRVPQAPRQVPQSSFRKISPDFSKIAEKEPTERAEPVIPPRPWRPEKTEPQTPPSEPERYTFANPYPSPETHKTKREEVQEGPGSPFILKSMTPRQSAFPEKPRVSQKDVSVQSPQRDVYSVKPPAPSSPKPPKKPPSLQTALPEPKTQTRNIIRPHHRYTSNMPEPKIKGNMVDLSGE